MNEGILWPKTGTIHNHAAQLGLPDKGLTIKGLVVTKCYGDGGHYNYMNVNNPLTRHKS